MRDCGVSCLLSIIKYYNGYVSLEKLRVDTKTTIEGTNALNIINAAKSYGFTSYGVKLENIDDLNNVVLPAIAHVVIKNLNHFVVIYKITKKNVILMDPAKGKRTLSFKEFENIWSKTIIVLYPKTKIIRESNRNYLKDLLFRVVNKKKKLVIKIIILTILFSLFTVLTSYYFKVVLSTSYDRLSTLIICLFFLLLLIKYAILSLRNYLKLALNKYIDGIIYSDFIKHLFSLPNYFIKNRTTGEIMTRVGEVGNLKTIISEFLVTIVVDSIVAIPAGIMLYKFNKNIFLSILIFIIIYLIYGFYIGKKVYNKATNTNDEETRFNTSVVDVIDTYTSFKNLNIMNLIKRKVSTKLFKYLTKLNDFNITVLKTNNFNYILEQTLTFTIITLCIFYVTKNELSITDYVIIENLLVYFITPFKSLINLIPNYNFFKISLNKLNEFYNVAIEEDEKGYQEFKNDDIVIKDFSYSYDNFNKLFEHLNLVIKKNNFVLLKGKSGSGKSTLCQIISRHLETNSTNIKIGSISIKDYSLKSIRKNITYVGQKESLLQDSIRNNIILDRNIKEEYFKKVIDICEIEDIISNKPLRYETEVLKDAINLSGGEKQRIILARAILNDFNILILDEALSEVNSSLEETILKKLRKEFKNKTIIYVSHKTYNDIFDEVIDFEKLY